MIYSVHSHQSDDILEQADEIKFLSSTNFYDIAEKYPDKKFVLEVDKSITEEGWLGIAAAASEYDITVCLDALELAQECIKRGFKFYWKYPITSYYELRGLIDLGVSQVFLGAPLYFDLPFISRLGVPIRLCANQCYFDSIPREDGVCGTYIRPEDVDIYDKYIETIEFLAPKEKEATLFKIYKNKVWKGNLDILLNNFNWNVDNRIIPEQFGEARVQCRQSCQGHGSCKLCYSAIKLAGAVDRAYAVEQRKQ